MRISPTRRLGLKSKKGGFHGGSLASQFFSELHHDS